LTCSGFTNSSGKLQIISNKEWRKFLQPKQSPDRLDVVVMAVAAEHGLTLTGWGGSDWLTARLLRHTRETMDLVQNPLPRGLVLKRGVEDLPDTIPEQGGWWVARR
jgi:hypothetical protein